MSERDEAGEAYQRRKNDASLITFNREISFGTIIATVLMVGSVIGGVFKINNDFQTSMNAFDREQREQKVSLENLKIDLIRVQSEEATFRSEVRSAITTLGGALSDIRVKVAEQGAQQQQQGRK